MMTTDEYDTLQLRMYNMSFDDAEQYTKTTELKLIQDLVVFSYEKYCDVYADKLDYENWYESEKNWYNKKEANEAYVISKDCIYNMMDKWWCDWKTDSMTEEIIKHYKKINPLVNADITDAVKVELVIKHLIDKHYSKAKTGLLKLVKYVADENNFKANKYPLKLFHNILYSKINTLAKHFNERPIDIQRRLIIEEETERRRLVEAERRRLEDQRLQAWRDQQLHEQLMVKVDKKKKLDEFDENMTKIMETAERISTQIKENDYLEIMTALGKLFKSRPVYAD